MRVGIAGAGMIVPGFLSAAALVEQMEIYAVFARREEVRKELCEKYQKPEAEAFFHRVFDYWKTMPEDSETYQYQAFLLACLSDGCRRLWSPRTGGEVRDALDRIESQDIWELIAGDGKDGIVNEITFFNERLKNTTISFVLKDRSEEAIEKYITCSGISSVRERSWKMEDLSLP